MAQEHHHTHHHHHSHHKDGATIFKQKSLLAIERRKTIAKWLWRVMVATAIILAIAVVIVYTL